MRHPAGVHYCSLVPGRASKHALQFASLEHFRSLAGHIFSFRRRVALRSQSFISGIISGIPTVTGSNVFAVLATDASGAGSELVCGLRVIAHPPSGPAMPAGIVSWWR